MEFRILGPLEVREGDRVLLFPGARQRALLSILLLRANESLPATRLIELLWGDRAPKSAAKGLQGHISELRKVLGKSCVVTRPPGYALRVQPGELDLDRFEKLTAEARELPPQDALSRLQEALALWRGQPLGEFVAERFAASEILRLEEMHLEAVEQRIEVELALGRHGGLLGELEALVREHPSREQLRAQLMLALYRAGRQVDALSAYQDARRVLVEELGLEPGRTLKDLEQAILRHDPALDAEVRAPARPPRPAVETAAAAAPQPAVHERKLATVLFVDLVGSTRLGEQDPERTRVLLERYYDAVADEIEDAGGTVEKFAGDAVLAAFGAPAAQEDHAERALHAALAVRSRCDSLFGSAIALHIGVNTGEVVVGRAREGSSFVTGDAVNVAARLEQIATPGEILVGERTAAAAQGAFEFGPPTTVPAKGKADGVGCRRLVRALALVRPRGVAGFRRAFVGRERELELLQATYRRAVDGREPHLVTIAGEAGVGKTRLVDALWQLLARQSPEPVRHAGRCLPYGRGVTYRPLADVLKGHLGTSAEDSEAILRAGLGERQILAVTLGLEPPSELHPLAVRESLHAAWVDFVEELVSVRPAVVFVEDLHWGEEPLLDLLDRLRREVAGPLLLVTTARPELMNRHPDWSAGGRNTTQLWLEPLSTRDAEQMLEQLLETDVPERLRRLVLDRAEGNPFFVEELLATFTDRGLLKRENGGWTMLEPPGDFAIPDTVQSVLAARIDLLDEPAKTALQAAAVVGRVFWAGPVGELTGIPDIDWRTLEDRDFVRGRHASTLTGEREFAFKHALTREVAYASLPKARRARLHAAFAAWLERLGESRDDYAPLLAHHYAEAVRPEDVDLAWAADAQARLEPLRAKARSWLRRAAELARSRYAVDEQLSLLRKALELEPDLQKRVSLWEEIAHANALIYDNDGFQEAILSAIAACSDQAKRAGLLGEGAFQSAVRWQMEADRELIEDWSGRALALGGAASRARGQALIARALCRPQEAEADAREAETIALDLDDPELHSFTLFVRADVALAAADYDEARRLAERRLETLSRIEDPDHRADALWAALPAYLGSGHFDDARRIAQRHDEVTMGLTSHHRLHGVAVLLEVEQLAGDWEQIRQLTPRAKRAAEQNTTRCLHNRLALLTCALASAYLGDDDEARRLEVRSEASGVDHYGRTESAIWLALHRGDLAAIERLLDDLERPRNSLIRSRKFAPIAARLDALAALERRDALERDAPQLLQPGTYLEPFALRALGIIRDDRELVEHAAVSFEAMALGWHAAQTRNLLRSTQWKVPTPWG
jgi:DNA-binding SARP family transcriptional activator